jgi:hypothetical protein
LSSWCIGFTTGNRGFVGPSFDYDIETLKGVARLRERRGDIRVMVAAIRRTMDIAVDWPSNASPTR